MMNRSVETKRILVVGSSNTDMVIKTEHLPAPGETVLGGTFFMNPGGKGANQAVAVARLGGNVRFVCKLGDDIFGRQAKQLFAAEGIDTSYVFTDSCYSSCPCFPGCYCYRYTSSTSKASCDSSCAVTCYSS